MNDTSIYLNLTTTPFSQAYDELGTARRIFIFAICKTISLLLDDRKINPDCAKNNPDYHQYRNNRNLQVFSNRSLIFNHLSVHDGREDKNHYSSESSASNLSGSKECHQYVLQAIVFRIKLICHAYRIDQSKICDKDCCHCKYRKQNHSEDVQVLRRLPTWRNIKEIEHSIPKSHESAMHEHKICFSEILHSR